MDRARFRGARCRIYLPADSEPPLTPSKRPRRPAAVHLDARVGCQSHPARASRRVGCAELLPVPPYAVVLGPPARDCDSHGAARLADAKSGARIQRGVSWIVCAGWRRDVRPGARTDTPPRRGGCRGAHLRVPAVPDFAHRSPPMADDRLAAAQPVVAPPVRRDVQIPIPAWLYSSVSDRGAHRLLSDVLRAVAACRRRRPGAVAAPA